jgi:hypothetical protein
MVQDLTNPVESPVADVPLPTSADVSSGKLLTFSGIKDGRAGMWVQRHTIRGGVGVERSTSAHLVVTAIHGDTIKLSQSSLCAVPKGTRIDFADSDPDSDAGAGFCLNDFHYVDESVAG